MLIYLSNADMAELADATVLGAVGSPVQVQVLLSAVKSGFLRHFGCLENPVFLCLTSTLTSTPMDEWKYIFVLNVADVFCSVFRCDKIKSRRWKMEKPDIFLFPFSSIALKDKGGSGIG